jgi:hypothetical protein
MSNDNVQRIDAIVNGVSAFIGGCICRINPTTALVYAISNMIFQDIGHKIFQALGINKDGKILQITAEIGICFGSIAFAAKITGIAMTVLQGLVISFVSTSFVFVAACFVIVAAGSVFPEILNQRDPVRA